MGNQSSNIINRPLGPATLPSKPVGSPDIATPRPVAIDGRIVKVGQ